jgi:hypothetical protein
MAFTPTKGTYLLTQLDLAIAWTSGTNGYTLELDADNHGLPGRTIAKWAVTGLPTYTHTPSTAVETLKVQGLIILSKGVQYWLVPIVYSNEMAGWHVNSVGINGTGAYSNDGGSTWATYSLSPYGAGAFDVLGLKLF